MSIGEKIKNLRKEKNMSQEDLANILNVSRQTISKWETGESNPDFDKIVPLCNCFEISTDELLNVTNTYLEKEIVREKNKNSALMISICIIIFVVMCILIIILEEIGVNDSIIATISMVSLGAIAVVLVNYFLSRPTKNVLKMDKTTEKHRLIYSIINLVIVIVYVLYSFIMNSWAYSWIILIVGCLIKKIITLIMMLGGSKDE